MSGVKVSVATVAYNHERYVRDSVESALAQRTSFPFEIVIADDCSTDSTPRILRQLQAAHSDRIRLILREQNLGMQWNFARTVETCAGEYIAVLDSDDRWINSNKLQLQVDFLDANPDHAICFNRAHIRYESGGGPEYFPGRVKSVLTAEDFLSANKIPSCGTMYRRSMLPAFPDWYGDVVPYDWVLNTLIVIAGHSAGFIDLAASEYRIHGGNLFSGASEKTRLEREIEFYRHILPALPERLRAPARYGMAERFYDLANNRRKAGEREAAKAAYAEALALQSPGHFLPLRRRLRMAARLL